MIYKNIVASKFLCRPNRFIAHCMVDGEEQVCHVKNTGRCKELLVPNATVYLTRSDNPNRKTLFDLVAVKKGNRLINMDSNAPNTAVGIWLSEGNLIRNPTLVRAETKYGNSRFDFYVESEQEKAFVEVKGVTLEKDGVAMFPDAPTQRGVKHINELVNCIEDGYKAYLLLVVQMNGVKYFTPNKDTDPDFYQAIKGASAAGVKVLAMDCIVTPNDMVINKKVEVRL